MSAVFLEESEIVVLTGRKIKSKQIEALRKMGLPFFVNAVGKPIVTRSAAEGRKEQQMPTKWEMPRHGSKAKQA
ncbi:MAG TPA: DUF4224 domain-containing protein [Noviherbaspirillum sp.]|jgi:hypothetical protein|uniref:DUF4224 domain-containing protein n=1 Tax=Noviherbaspirillum sp. TaxID=1926288 RepID=UPI002DDC915F|nr:DUF4224 domain-containing protein [Noviherbaspirillum sp.]HEV2612497.1 DUF4224 domain-containing protein [Noviherbaspirillum sp.]